MVHMPLGERIGLDNSIPIVPSIAIPIPVTIVVVVAIMVVTIPTMMVVSSTMNMAIPTIVVMSMVMSSIATIRSTWLLMRSRVILATTVVVVLPLAVLNGLLLAFQHNSFVYERLAVSKISHCQLDSQLIIQPLQELLLSCCIIPDIIWSISCKLVEQLNILGH